MRDFTGHGVFRVETAAQNREQQKPGSFGCLIERKIMKNLNVMAIVAAVVAMFTFTTSAKAQAVADDGIAASPKLRQFLNERNTVASTPSTGVVSVGYREPGDDGIAASPKLRQLLNERKTVASAPSTGVASVGYSEPGKDGIAASPKLRQQINERGTHVMIAPLK